VLIKMTEIDVLLQLLKSSSWWRSKYKPSPTQLACRQYSTT